MPLVASGFELTVVLVDSGNDTATKKYQLQATTYADAVTDAGVILGVLVISTAVVRSYKITENYINDAFNFPTAVEIENQAEIVVRLVETGKYGTIYIPAPNASIFVAGSGDGYNIVDGTAPLVAAYLAIYNENAQAFISDGEFITPTVAQRFKSGKRIHKASQNG